MVSYPSRSAACNTDSTVRHASDDGDIRRAEPHQVAGWRKNRIVCSWTRIVRGQVPIGERGHQRVDRMSLKSSASTS